MGVVVLVTMITIATSLLKLRDEVYELQGQRGAAAAPDHREEIEDLRAEIAELRAAVEAREGEAAADRRVIKEALARVLHQHEAGASVINALLEGMSDEDQRRLMAELGAAGPLGGHEDLRAAIGALKLELESSHGGNGSNGDEEANEAGDSDPPPPEPEPTPTPPEPEPRPEPEPMPEPEPAPEPPTPEPAPPSPEPAPPPIPQFTEYTVAEGDSLLKIARRHKVSVEAIAEANGITNPNHIRVGQVLKIPTGE